MILYFIFSIFLERLYAVYLYDYVDSSPRSLRLPSAHELEFEPVAPPVDEKEKEKLSFIKNINCEDFSIYALNCTVEAALMYNSSRKAPPMPAKIADWCKAIRHLTNCAIDWNADCKDVTESHFNDESIRGHMHVVTNICEDEWYLSKYDSIPYCIDRTTSAWEDCYTVFKSVVDEQKNSTHEWTHYETHFALCCARTQFRRCTFEALFNQRTSCTYDQALTLQKFSVVVSAGDVFQDCESNMLYSNCPGGDPRPSVKALGRLMNAEAFNAASGMKQQVICIVLCVALLIVNKISTS